MLRKFFGKKEEDEAPIRIPTLSTMQVGDLVDYDLKTWEVAGFNTYDYAGQRTDEWELKSGDDVAYLERGIEDNSVWWTFMRRCNLQTLNIDLAAHMRQQEDPPETLTCQKTAFQAVESSAGLMRPGGQEPAREFISWTYESDDGEMLAIAQWDEADFSAFRGQYVEEYQFTDILPGSQSND